MIPPVVVGLLARLSWLKPILHRLGNLRGKDLVIALLVVAVAVLLFVGWRKDRAADRQDTQLAAMQSEKARHEAERLGWTQETAEGQRSLHRLYDGLSEDISPLRLEVVTLLGEFAVLRVKPIAITIIAATVAGTVNSEAEAHGPEDQPPDSFTAPIDDGILSGRVAFFPVPARFDLDYSVGVRFALVHSEAPDGQLLVTAKPEDPRVHLEITRVEYELPAGSAGGCGLWCWTRRVVVIGVPTFAAGRWGPR